MRFGLIRDLVAGTRRQVKMPAVFEFGVQGAAQAEQDMAFFAPMVCQIASTVLNHTHPNRAELARAPKGFARGARVLGDFNA